MSRSTPSMLALLGLVAVAGYQNRGRISEMLSDADHSDTRPGSTTGRAAGGFLAEIGEAFRNANSGKSVSTALGELVERFTSAGQGAAAASWVSHQPNATVGIADLEATLGPDTLAELTERTGLSRTELLMRLNASLPDVVNRFTPEGRLPTEDEGRNFT